MKRKIYVLSSTHWDREWYETFEQYRFRLVRLIDRLMDILESQEDYRYFHFDGQTILIEDYLRIRPENRERLCGLIRAGRILIGPWYVMPDEFLIGGEALIRNLERGDKIAKELGVETNKSGYVCDIFGHNSQMPQIFKNFGIDNAQFFRGREGYEKDNFLWVGADGTETIAHKLHPDYAYSSFFFVARWPFEGREYDEKELVERVKKYLSEEEGNFATEYHLMIDGVDHSDPESKLPYLLEILNKNIEGYEFVHSNLEDYTAKIRERTAGLKRVYGALYQPAKEGVNNNVIKNVLSSMVHIKQANDYCETALALKAEPMDLFEQMAGLDRTRENYAPYGGYLEEAWDNVLKNQPHDSICGCSITPVHEDNVNRYRHAKEIVDLTCRDLLENLASNVSGAGEGRDGSFIVFNNSPCDIDGVTEVMFEIAADRHQWNFKFFDEAGKEVPYAILEHEGRSKKFSQFKKLISFPRYDYFKLAMQLKIPAYGYTVVGYEILNIVRTNKNGNWKFDEFKAPARYLGTMRTAANVVDNGKLIVEVCRSGTLSVTDKETGKVYRNLLTLEDTADVGDGWNYRKPVFDEEIHSSGCDAEIAVTCDSPLLTRFKVTVNLSLPRQFDGENRSTAKERLAVTSYITICRGEKRITVRTETENNCVNHRLRVLFPTQLKTDGFLTRLPFDLYRWNVKKENNSEFLEADTFVNPNQGGMTISDGENAFTLYNKGLYEVAVLDRPDMPVCLTLYRSFTNEVSENRAVMGQMLFPMRFDYCMDFERLSSSEVIKRSDAFKVGLSCMEATPSKTGRLSGGERILQMSGNAVLSSLRAVGAGVGEIRIYDVDGGAKGEIGFALPVKCAKYTDMRGNEVSKVTVEKGKIKYDLKSKQIATIRFEF